MTKVELIEQKKRNLAYFQKRAELSTEGWIHLTVEIIKNEIKHLENN